MKAARYEEKAEFYRRWVELDAIRDAMQAADDPNDVDLAERYCQKHDLFNCWYCGTGEAL